MRRQRERERDICDEERENGNKIIIYILCNCCLREYCSMLQTFETFNTSDNALFLVFGVSNVPNIWHLTHIP